MSQNLLKASSFVNSHLLRNIYPHPALRSFGTCQISVQGQRSINTICHFRQLFNKNPIFQKSIRNFRNNVLDVNTNVANNVVLWKYKGSTYFKNLGIFGLFQCVVLFGFSYSIAHIIPKWEENETLWQYTKKAWMEVSIVTVPILTAFGSLALIRFYTLRSLKSIILHKGGKHVTIISFHPFQESVSRVVPVENVFTKKSRKEISTYMSLKIKGSRFFYLICRDGTFVNPELFDNTIGADKSNKKR